MMNIVNQKAMFSDKFSCPAGQSVWSRCRFGVNSGSTGGAAYVQVFLRSFDYNGAYLTDTFIDSGSYAAGNFYTRGIVAFNVPAGTVTAQLVIGLDLPYAAGTTGSNIFIDYFDISNTQFGATLGANRRNIPQTFGGGVQLVYSVDPLSASTTSGGVATIAVAAHSVADGNGSPISYAAGSITGLAASTRYAVYEDDPTYAGGTRTYLATTTFSDLAATSGRRVLGYITTPAAGATGTGSTGGGTGGGGRGGGGGTAIP